MFLRGAACQSAKAGANDSFFWWPLLFWPLASERSWCAFGRPSAPDETELDAKPRFWARVSTLSWPRVTASAMACVSLRCFLFSDRVSPAAAPCWNSILSSALAASLRPGALLTSQLQSPAWLSALRVCLHECAPSLLAQTLPPESTATCLLVRRRAPARLSLPL